VFDWLQLTKYNAQCLENVQQQNRQIELLGQQLADSHNRQQQLLHRIQQLQQRQQSCDDDVKPGLSNQQLKSASTPVLLNGSADELTSKSVADADCRISQVSRLKMSKLSPPQTNTFITRMWANAQPDGRLAEHRWRPLFNAAKFG